MTQGPSGEDKFLKAFNDPDHVARYPEGPPRFVPGLDALHRMAVLLLAERAPETARMLVLGAGGGAEILALAQMYPGWRFVGVDPASAPQR
jgi:tRNA (cmo5U34)-methyltransferase